MLNNLLYAILLALGFPLGIYLAYLCSDEIKKWRKRLVIISAVCFIIAIAMIFVNFSYKIPSIITLFFMIITCLTIIWKSH